MGETFISLSGTLDIMPVHNVKKKTKQALAAARELERIPMPSEKEIVSLYKEGLEEAQKLNKILKQAWFVKDTDKAPHRGDAPPVRRVRIKRPRK